MWRTTKEYAKSSIHQTNPSTICFLLQIRLDEYLFTKKGISLELTVLPAKFLDFPVRLLC